jgi:hypothetical protein
VENKDIVYMGDILSGLIYKSTNGAWFFNLPVNSTVAGTVFDIEMCPSYPAKPVAGKLLVSGTAAAFVVRSVDGGASFIPVTPSIGGAFPAIVYADEGFAANNLIYAAVNGNAGGIWRWVIGTSTSWELISAAPVTGPALVPATFRPTGLMEQSGVLYVTYNNGGGIPSGVLRTLYPTVPITGVIWENLTIGAAAAVFNVAPKASVVGGTNALWTINTAGAGALMAYDDTMAVNKAAPVVPELVAFDSVSGRNQQFVVSWPQVSNANTYRVEIYIDPGGSDLVWWAGAPAVWPVNWLPSNPVQPAWVVAANTLVAGQDYFLRIRAVNQTTGDGNWSAWSSVFRFSVKGGERVEVSYTGVQPLGPLAGAIGVPQSPGFTWSPYASATRYEFQLSKDPAFATTIAAVKVTTTAYKYDGKLDFKTTYFWRARGIEPTVTDWSPVASFTVEAAPPAPPAPAPAPPPAPPPVVTPAIIWSIIGIGAILVIAVIALIVRTRKVA